MRQMVRSINCSKATHRPHGNIRIMDGIRMQRLISGAPWSWQKSSCSGNCHDWLIFQGRGGHCPYCRLDTFRKKQRSQDVSVRFEFSTKSETVCNVGRGLPMLVPIRQKRTVSRIPSTKVDLWPLADRFSHNLEIIENVSHKFSNVLLFIGQWVISASARLLINSAGIGYAVDGAFWKLMLEESTAQ